MDSICRIDQRSVCLRLRRVTPSSPSDTAAEQHRQNTAHYSRRGSGAVPYSRKRQRHCQKCTLEQSCQQTAHLFTERCRQCTQQTAHAYGCCGKYRHDAAGAALPGHQLRKTGQSCRCYSHPQRPEKQKRKKLRRETSRFRHNKTASLHIVYAGRRFMYARC